MFHTFLPLVVIVCVIDNETMRQCYSGEPPGEKRHQCLALRAQWTITSAGWPWQTLTAESPRYSANLHHVGFVGFYRRLKRLAMKGSGGWYWVGHLCGWCSIHRTEMVDTLLLYIHTYHFFYKSTKRFWVFKLRIFIYFLKKLKAKSRYTKT